MGRREEHEEGLPGNKKNMLVVSADQRITTKQPISVLSVFSVVRSGGGEMSSSLRGEFVRP